MFKLEGYIKENHVFFDLKANSKRGVIKEMVKRICEADGIPDQEEELLTHVLNREKIESTGIGEGLAIPHCHYDKFEGVHIYVGFPKSPIDFKSVDGTLVRLIFMIISDNNNNDKYLKALSRLMYLLRNVEIRNKLFNTYNADDFFQLVKKSDEQLDYISYEGLKNLMTLLELENEIDTYSNEILITKGKRQGKADLKEDSQFHRLEDSRNRLMDQIDHRLLNIYRQLNSKYNGSIFASVVRNTCSHCNVQVTVHLIREINRQNQIIQCSTCAKILTRVGR